MSKLVKKPAVEPKPQQHKEWQRQQQPPKPLRKLNSSSSSLSIPALKRKVNLAPLLKPIRKKTNDGALFTTRAAPLTSDAAPANTVQDRLDQQGLIHCAIGDLIGDRYQVLALAGRGTFGTVFHVYDHQRKAPLALKVVRSVPRYFDAALVEVDILERIRAADVRKQSGCVRLYKVFSTHYANQMHICLGFERLGSSLFDFIKRNKYSGFPLAVTRSLAFQLLKAVAFCHSISLIHTDLKPENILFVNIDFR
jgi:hypothetical protein